MFYSSYGHHKVEAYTNADWAKSVTDRRLTFGYYTFIGGNLVTWSKKQQLLLDPVQRQNSDLCFMVYVNFCGLNDY